MGVEEDKSLKSLPGLTSYIFGIIGVIILVLNLQNPIWVMIMMVLVIAALIFIAWFYLTKIRKIKRIFYRIISYKEVLVVKLDIEIQGRVQILLDNKQVKDANMITLKIWNSGTLAIQSGDYHNTSFKVNLGAGAEILEVKVLDAAPKSLQSEIEKNLRFDSENITLDLPTLYTKNAVTLKVLLTNYNGEIFVDNMQIKEGQIMDWEKTTFVWPSKRGVIYWFSMLFTFFVSFIITLFLVVGFTRVVSLFGVEIDIFNSVDVRAYMFVFLFFLPLFIMYITGEIIKKVAPDILPI